MLSLLLAFLCWVALPVTAQEQRGSNAAPAPDAAAPDPGPDAEADAKAEDVVEDDRTGAPGSGEQPEFERPAPPPINPEVERYLLQRFDEARELYRLRDYQGAFRLADAILVMAPDISFRGQLKKFRRRAQGRFVSGSVLTAHFQPLEPTEDTPAEYPTRRLTGHVIIENVSSATVRIGTPGERSVIGQADFLVTEVYANGDEWTTGSRPLVKIPEGFELKPDEIRELEFSVEFTEGLGDPLLQLYRVEGKLLPTEMQVGEKQLSRSVPWIAVTGALVPPELGDVLERPYRHLRIGLVAEDAQHLQVAAQLWLQQLAVEGEMAIPLRDATVNLLIDGLATTGEELHPTIIKILRRLTGEGHATAAAWFEWARQQTTGREGVGAGE